MGARAARRGDGALGARGRAQSGFRAGAHEPRQRAARGRPHRGRDDASAPRAAACSPRRSRTTISASRSQCSATRRGGRHFRRAIAMQPGFVEPYLNLALELANRATVAQALGFVRRSLRIRETPDNKALFVRIASATGDRQRCGSARARHARRRRKAGSARAAPRAASPIRRSVSAGGAIKPGRRAAGRESSRLAALAHDVGRRVRRELETVPRPGRAGLLGPPRAIRTR